MGALEINKRFFAHIGLCSEPVDLPPAGGTMKQFRGQKANPKASFLQNEAKNAVDRGTLIPHI